MLRNLASDVQRVWWQSASRAISEVELLENARRGDALAGEKLFLDYLQNSHSIRSLLRRVLPNSEDQREMLQEIYLELITGHTSFEGKAKLKTYIYRVARTTVFARFRRQNTLKRGGGYRVISGPFEIADELQSNPEYKCLWKEKRNHLLQLIQLLPACYRDVLCLRILKGFSYQEIAERLSSPINSVSSKIHKGKKLLLAKLRNEGWA